MGRCIFDGTRYLPLVAVIALLAGCDGEDGKPIATPSGPTTSPPTSDVSKPTSPRPKAPCPDGPPAAWLETENGSFWLGYSSYCWGTACVDFIAPSCDNPKYTPKIPVRRGELLTVHLAFQPAEFGLSFRSKDGQRSMTDPQKLRLSRTPSWRAEQEGAFLLFARAKRGGDASYVACVEFR
jgi:hypothetical protein